MVSRLIGIVKVSSGSRLCECPPILRENSRPTITPSSFLVENRVSVVKPSAAKTRILTVVICPSEKLAGRGLWTTILN